MMHRYTEHAQFCTRMHISQIVEYARTCTEMHAHTPRMVTCELSHVGCCLRRRQQQISTCRSQEGGKSFSRAENDPRRLSQKVEKK